MRRDIFIGDVHGCIDELEELLALLELSLEDRLFFVGDYVDRGPDSVGVVRKVKALLAQYPGSAAITGNHEEKALRYRGRGRALPSWAERATEEDWSFLDALPLVHRLQELGVLLVHGGLFPRFFDLHGSIGDVSSSWRRDKGKRADRLRRFLRIRRVNPDGNMVGLQDESPKDVHWAELYDGREGFCFFGHDPQLSPPEPLRAHHAIGLDTGCCFGGRLTAAIVPEQARPGEATFVSVAARAQYSEPRLIHEE